MNTCCYCGCYLPDNSTTCLACGRAVISNDSYNILNGNHISNPTIAELKEFNSMRRNEEVVIWTGGGGASSIMFSEGGSARWPSQCYYMDADGCWRKI